MINITCDRCGKEKLMFALDVSVTALHNPIPHSVHDIGAPKIGNEAQMRFILCEKCAEEMGFPNIYKAENHGVLEFPANKAEVSNE